MIKRIPFTQQGFTILSEELNELVKSRPLAVLELQRSRELGDLSENTAHRVAKQKVGRMDKRIRQIRNILKYAFIVKPSQNKTIEIGSSFVLTGNNQTHALTLVNTFESNFEKGLLSSYSPIGKGVFGKKKGEVVSISTPKGKNNFTITHIG